VIGFRDEFWNLRVARTLVPPETWLMYADLAAAIASETVGAALGEIGREIAKSGTNGTMVRRAC